MKKQKSASYLRGVSVVVLVLSAIILSFQNCSGQFEVMKLGQDSSQGLPSQMTNLDLADRFTASEVDRVTTIDPSQMTCTAADQTNYSVPSTLKYFGVVGGFAKDTDSFEEFKRTVVGTLKMGNLQFVEVKVFDDPAKTQFELRRRMDFVLQFPVAAVLSVSNVFWNQDVPGQLRFDRDQQWKAVVDVLKMYPQSRIAAFYLLDEAFWNAKNLGISESQMYSWLSTFGGQIKSAFPASKLTLIEAYPMVDSTLRWPDVFDWIGADCYVENCGGGKSIFDLFTVLKTKLKSHQRLVVIPTAIVFKKPSDFSQANSVWMRSEFERYMKWIATEPLVEASFSFIYHYAAGTEDMTAMENSCHSSEAHQLYAAKFRLSPGAVRLLPVPPYVGASCTYTTDPTGKVIPVGGTVREIVKCQGVMANTVVKIVGTQNGLKQIDAVIQLTNGEFRSEYVNTGAADAGLFVRRVEVYTDGRLTATSPVIQVELAAAANPTPTPTPTPAPTPRPTPTPAPKPAVVDCKPTTRTLAKYSMSGTIQPATTDVGRVGALYVAGFDPIEAVWWSFDGSKWVKNDPAAKSLVSFGGIKTLSAAGFSGSIFLNEDMSVFPGAEIYVAYGVSPSGLADPVATWEEMLAAKRYKLCDVLPTE
jgi:hypothetical protein